ncbi:MAG TPA: SMC-Scp complex subunit ScpB [Candidatus Kapabacteria bacterium]|nr:SMC-Scp complex subunit ScpB [Candidatus Kapabacteria bacterium]
MSKQFRVAIDPQSFKPVIEAMIFASEEPLPVRTLMRLLAGEREEKEAAIPPLTAMMAASEHGLDPEAIADAMVEDSGMEPEPADDAMEEEIVVQVAAAPEPAAEDPNALAEAMQEVDARNAGTQVIDQAYVRTLIAELNEEYDATGRAFRIVEVAGGFQFATTRDFGEYVALLSKEKLRRRLSPAALETLAIIAYRQPVAKPEVEAIRGVNCDQVLLSLMEKNLVAITGRSEGVGRPLLYGTTEDFLRVFGLKGLGDLPKLREIEELMEEGAFSPEKAEVITVDRDSDASEIEALVGAAGHAGDEEHGSIELADDTIVEPGTEALETASEESAGITAGDEADTAGDAEGDNEEEEGEEGDEDEDDAGDEGEDDGDSDDEGDDEEGVDVSGDSEEEDDGEEADDEDGEEESDHEEEPEEEEVDEVEDGDPDEAEDARGEEPQFASDGAGEDAEEVGDELHDAGNAAGAHVDVPEVGERIDAHE